MVHCDLFEIERRFPLHAGVSVRHLSMAAEAKAQRHQSGSGGSGDAAGVATGDDEEVELLAAAASYFFVSCFLFSLAAACGAFVWIAADSRHG